VPIIAVALTFFALPESPRFLAIHKHRAKELATLLNAITGTSLYSESNRFVSRMPAPQSSTGLGLLFSGDLLSDTIGVWLIFFSNLFSAFTFLSWSPIILTSLGYPFGVAMRGLLLFNLAGIAGSALTAWTIAYFGSRSALVALSLIAAASLLFISRLVAGADAAEAAGHIALLMAAFGCAGFALIGIQVAAYGLSAHIYPTEIRSSGVGWAAGVGRLGSILSTFVSGIAFVWLRGPGLFIALSIIVSLTLLGVVLVHRHMRD
jgi:AAHS family 4-hydroxybenzoate transporter-like MFS transporter